jgi:hypothetical protein
MRENRPYGSEGGEANAFPTPIGAMCDAVGLVRLRRENVKRIA